MATTAFHPVPVASATAAPALVVSPAMLEILLLMILAILSVASFSAGYHIG